MLAEFENVLARLATDAAARDELRREGASSFASARLSPRERAFVTSIPLPLLERYARSLLAKRWGELKKVIPLTVRVSPGLEKRYRTWAERHPATAEETLLSPGCREARRALPHLEEALLDDPGEGPYTAALLAYEVLAACSREDGEPRTLRARMALHEIAADLRAGVIPIDPEIRPHAYVFDKRRIRWSTP